MFSRGSGGNGLHQFLELGGVRVWELTGALLGVDWLACIRKVTLGKDGDLKVAGGSWVGEKLELEMVVWHHSHQLVDGFGALGSVTSPSAVLDLDVVGCLILVSDDFSHMLYQQLNLLNYRQRQFVCLKISSVPFMRMING